MSKEPTYVGTFFERYVEKGLELGRQEGRQEGSRETATRILFTLLGVRWPSLSSADLVPLTVSATQEALLAAVEPVAREQDSPLARSHLNTLLAPR